MKFSPDSPELTAYAVGELPEPERTALEAQLAVDPELQSELTALLAATEQLRSDFAAEPQPELAPVQRAWIEGRATAPPSPGAPIPAARSNSPRGWPWSRWLLGTLAAATAVMVAIRVMSPSRKSDRGSTLEIATGPASPPPLPSPVPLSAPARPPETATPRSITANAPQGAVRTTTTPTSTASVATDALARSPTASRTSGAPQQPIPVQADGRSRGLAKRDGAEAELQRKSAQISVAPNVTVTRRTSIPVADSALPAPRPAAAPVETMSQRPAEFRAAIAESIRIDPLLARRYGLPVASENAREAYTPITENPFRPVEEAPLSTFGMDVDTASYANVRRFLREGMLPPPDAVRLEELINYFPYDLPAPQGKDPFGVIVEVATCPWNNAHRLIRVAVKARDIPRGERPRANLVFLVDVSGSMEPENKLPLVKKSLRLLVEQLTPQDRVALVTYAGEAGVVLDSTPGSEKPKILAAIDRLGAGGSTHGSAGIQSAYEIARKSYDAESINRVLLCTDGDFNVGTVSREGLMELITEQARSGVFLSVLGFGVGNYQDATAELLADRGNGNYAYIDSFREARKVLREQLQSTLVTVAKDAKIQIEFNPAKVARWRLLGYENRVLADRDFKDDQKDAGDVGAGQSVTVLYEIVPAGPQLTGVDPLRYQRQPEPVGGTPSDRANVTTSHRGELFFLKLRHKLPTAATSTEWTTAVQDDDRLWTRTSDDFQFSAAVAGFGLLLRNSAHRGTVTHDTVLRLAQEGLGADAAGYRAEFIDLVRQAQRLQGHP